MARGVHAGTSSSDRSPEDDRSPGHRSVYGEKSFPCNWHSRGKSFAPTTSPDIFKSAIKVEGSLTTGWPVNFGGLFPS